MTPLRTIMLEELERRHCSEATIQRYIRSVERFAQHFHCSPDRLGRRHIQEYQAQLFTVQKLSPGSVTNHLCALRFFYIQTLKKPWSIADTPRPKKRLRLPTILSQEETAQLIDTAPTAFYRTVIMTLYATSVRNAELTRLKVTDVDSKRMVVHVQSGKGRQDRDVMLNPLLLDVLRAHWRRGTIEALTRALAVELALIRVNAVSRGVVRTNLWQRMSAPEPNVSTKAWERVSLLAEWARLVT